MPKLKDRGDTIVEVMVALAILGLAFAISYSTAQSALNSVQNSQEHSTALELLDTQLEELRYLGNQQDSPVPSLTSPFCLAVSGNSVHPYFFPGGSNPGVPGQGASLYPSQCQIAGSGFDYYVSITPSNQVDFLANIWWPGIGRLGYQSEQLAYRVYLQ